jgi:isopenicillin-N N-acyltransferase-like protein
LNARPSPFTNGYILKTAAAAKLNISKMLEVACSGSPQEVGFQHGEAAKVPIGRSMIFYQKLFKSKCKMDWPEVQQFALKYQPYLQENWPQYVSEMEGVATGAGVTYPEILALNVRTEIAFGAFNDGCTALSWKSSTASILAQNWDWETELVLPLSPHSQLQADGTCSLKDRLRISSFLRSRNQMGWE